MTERRIEGKRVVFVLLLVIVAVLAFAFYRYYTIEPGEGVFEVGPTPAEDAPQRSR